MSARLVILAPNWLGDAVMALPAIADVRRGAREASIAVAARPAIAPLFALVPGIDQTIVLDAQSSPIGAGWRALGAELADHAFDSAILLPNSMHAALVSAAARIPQRWGYRTQLRGRLLTRAIDPPRGLHQIEYYRQLVHALGFPHGDIEPRVVVGDAHRRAASALLHAGGWDGRAPLVAMAPGAAYGGAKRWPPDYFAELAAGFAADGVKTVVVGSAADAASASGIAGIDLVGRTDLTTLAGVFAHCRTLVTNDSGAMHLAAAAGVPVTAVFGPTRDAETRPIGDRHAVITNAVWCRPCMLRECPLDHRCLRGIAPAAVSASARRTL